MSGVGIHNGAVGPGQREDRNIILTKATKEPIDGLRGKGTKKRGDGNVDPTRDYADSPF